MSKLFVVLSILHAFQEMWKEFQEGDADEELMAIKPHVEAIIEHLDKVRNEVDMEKLKEELVPVLAKIKGLFE